MNKAEDSMSEVDLIRTLFEGKWRFGVIQKLCERPQRLSTLERLIPDASKKMLIDTLRGLEGLGWINRSDLSTDLKHVEYALAETWEKRIRFAIAKIAADPTNLETRDSRNGLDQAD
jgi:DNA-binding HxlR family transcriptional regulator